MDGLCTYDSDGEVINTRARRLQREIYGGRDLEAGKVYVNPPSPTTVLLRRWNDALGAQPFYQAFADV